jgi:hypothetical protein
MKGVATQEAADPHQGASKRTPALDGFTGIMGTCGIKPAVGTQKWRNVELVKVDAC